MSPSPLRAFNRGSIEELISEGVEMTYHPPLVKKNLWGLWRYDEYSITINPELIHYQGKAVEDMVIVHEWLHAYEDIILDCKKDFREKQIDWWAYFHLRRDQDIANYIRSFFSEQGF